MGKLCIGKDSLCSHMIKSIPSNIRFHAILCFLLKNPTKNITGNISWRKWQDIPHCGLHVQTFSMSKCWYVANRKTSTTFSCYFSIIKYSRLFPLLYCMYVWICTGCDLIMSMRKFDNHDQQCPFKEISCPQKCNLTIRRMKCVLWRLFSFLLWSAFYYDGLFGKESETQHTVMTESYKRHTCGAHMVWVHHNVWRCP